MHRIGLISLVVLGALLVAVLVGLLVVCWVPLPTIHSVAAFMAWRAGLVSQTLNIGDHEWHCWRTPPAVENNDAIAYVLLVHGYSARKETWISWIPHFRRAWRQHNSPTQVEWLIPDLPGHGQTRSLGDTAPTFTAEAQAERLTQFCAWAAPNDQPIHVVGISMGGGIAALTAQQLGSRCTSVSLMCPAGVAGAPDTEVSRAIKANPDDHPLLGEDAEALHTMLATAFQRPPWVPSPFLDALAAERRARGQLNRQVARDLLEDIHRLTPDFWRQLAQTTALMVLWGAQDRVLHTDAAWLIQDAAPNATVHVLDDCGHALQLDAGSATASLVANHIFSQVP